MLRRGKSRALALQTPDRSDPSPQRVIAGLTRNLSGRGMRFRVKRAGRGPIRKEAAVIERIGQI